MFRTGPTHDAPGSQTTFSESRPARKAHRPGRSQDNTLKVPLLPLLFILRNIRLPPFVCILLIRVATPLRQPPRFAVRPALSSP